MEDSDRARSVSRILELTSKKQIRYSPMRECYLCGRKGYKTTLKRVHWNILHKYVYKCRWECLDK